MLIYREQVYEKSALFSTFFKNPRRIKTAYILPVSLSDAMTPQRAIGLINIRSERVAVNESIKLTEYKTYGLLSTRMSAAKNRDVIVSASLSRTFDKSITLIIITARHTEGVKPAMHANTTSTGIISRLRSRNGRRFNITIKNQLRNIT